MILPIRWLVLSLALLSSSTSLSVGATVKITATGEGGIEKQLLQATPYGLSSNEVRKFAEAEIRATKNNRAKITEMKVIEDFFGTPAPIGAASETGNFEKWRMGEGGGFCGRLGRKLHRVQLNRCEIIPTLRGSARETAFGR